MSQELQLLWLKTLQLHHYKTMCAPPLTISFSAASVLGHGYEEGKEMGLNGYSVAIANGFTKILLVVAQW